MEVFEFVFFFFFFKTELGPGALNLSYPSSYIPNKYIDDAFLKMICLSILLLLLFFSSVFGTSKIRKGCNFVRL